MKRKPSSWLKALLLAMLLLPVTLGVTQAQGQLSTQTNNVYPPYIATATAQTSAPIVLGSVGGNGGSYSVGNISVTGVNLTTVTFQVLGSSDGGATYYALNVNLASTPATQGTTTTATASGLYQVNLSGITQVEIVTTGTFTATSVKFTLTASPNGIIARNNGSGGGAVASFNSRTGAVVPQSGDYSVSLITGAAPTASPAFTGTPTAPTQACASNNDIATGAYVANCSTGGGSGTVASGTIYSPAYYTTSSATVGGVTPFTGLAYYSTTAPPGAATGAQVASAISGQAVSPVSVSGAKIINGISYSVNYTGATVDVRVNACLYDSLNKTNGNFTGICDASGETGAQYSSAEIDVGDSSGYFVKLITPCAGAWYGTMTGGTAYVIKYYAGAEIQSGCPISALTASFFLGASGGSNLYAVFGATTSSQNYLHLSGFQVQNFGHATASGYTAIISGQFADGSGIEYVNVFDNVDVSGGAVLLQNVCCGFTWAHSSISGNDVATPLVIQASDSPSTYIQDAIFTEGSIVQPGPNMPLISCTDTKSNHLTSITFTNEYIETGTSSPAASLVSSSNCSKLAFDHVQVYSNSAGDAQTFLTTTANTAVTLDDIFFSSSLGYWTYPVTVLSQSGVTTQATDSTGHYGHYTTATAPSSFGPISVASCTGCSSGINTINGFTNPTISFQAISPLTLDTSVTNILKYSCSTCLTGSAVSQQFGIGNGTGQYVNDPLLTDDGTTLRYSGTGGIQTAGTGTGHQLYVYSTGTVPALLANGAGWIGPAAGGTSYYIKFPATMTGGVAHFGAPTTGVDGVNESLMTSSPIVVADIGSTGGTASASTFFRGDGQWASTIVSPTVTSCTVGSGAGTGGSVGCTIVTGSVVASGEFQLVTGSSGTSNNSLVATITLPTDVGRRGAFCSLSAADYNAGNATVNINSSSTLTSLLIYTSLNSLSTGQTYHFNWTCP